jgi:hemerythrin superfamily protein
MLAEHKDIMAALSNLIDAARAENKLEAAQFTEKLMIHAEAEEEVFYPTALLIGRYVKSKLGV